MKEVYFVESDKDLCKLWDALKFKTVGKVAIKTHFGEEGNVTYPKPKLVKFFADKLSSPTLIEGNVLSKSERSVAKTHKELGKRHGFDFAPIDIIDGNEEFKKIKINLKHFKEALVGKNLSKYKSILGIAHFKGHGGSGFGGALKNFAVGLASRPGKLRIHTRIPLHINEDKCTSCGKCVGVCPSKAISIQKKANIDANKCTWCAKCINACNYNAINIPWHGCSYQDFQERLVEYFYAITKGKKLSYINFVVDITKQCDCQGSKMKPFMPDIGYLASDDAVALDQACFDLVKKKFGKDPFKAEYGLDSTHQLKYAEKIGVGTRKYKLVKL